MQHRCRAQALRHRNVTCTPTALRGPGVLETRVVTEIAGSGSALESGQIAPPATNATPVPGAGVASHGRHARVTRDGLRVAQTLPGIVKPCRLTPSKRCPSRSASTPT